ncbi:MAG: hypothetical protein JXA15_14425 [Spirochaetales bacterium]|nr:hypothetical protein [Spirochaetales bacterium]
MTLGIKPNQRFAFAVLGFLLACLPARADLYAPNRPLLEIRTERFSIAFPAELETTALRLAGFADDVWEEVAAKLDPSATGAVPRDAGRVPVLLTPDSDLLNGYRAGSPYGRIVLYAAPAELDSTLGSFDDELRSVFLHELTHELSLSIRSPSWRALASIFGDALAPASLWTAKAAMIEGVTVAFESEDASGRPGIQGRANDPLSMATVRQDLAEGVRRTWAQASGAGDRYPWGTIYYHYGGAFSRWLRETRGTEAYAALWKELGEGRVLSGDRSTFLSEGAFERAYGEDLDTLWNAFLDDATPRFALLPPRLLVPGSDGRAGPTARVAAFASGAGTLYLADASRAAVFALAPDGGSAARLFPVDGYVSRLDVSANGTRLLVSYARPGPGLPRSEVRVWDLARARWAGEPVEGLTAAAFRGDGNLVGLEPGAFESRLVEQLPDGSRRTLLAGGPRRSLGPPVPLPDGSIAFTADFADAPDGGRRWTVFRLLPDGAVVELAVGAGPGEDAADKGIFMAGGELGWPRFLSRGPDGTLLFSVARAEGFYRPAILDGTTLRVAGAEISGGVQRPVAYGATAGDRAVAYVGAFSDGERVCVLDPAAPELATLEYPAHWRLYLKADAAEDLVPPVSTAIEPGDETRFEIRTWNPWPWILKSFRWPVIDLAVEDDSIRARGVGAGAMFADPAERWTALVETSWDFAAGAADAYAELTLNDGPFAALLSVRDEFFASADGEPYRLSGATASASALIPFVPSWRRISARLSIGASRLAATDPGDPYGGERLDSLATLDASATYSGIHRETRRGAFGEESARAGFSIGVRGTLETTMDALDAPAPALEGAVEFAEAASAFSFAAWGAWAPLGGAAFGPAGRVLVDGGSASPSSLYPWYPLAGELAGAGNAASLYAQADARVALASLELQGKVFLLPLYLNRAGLAAGARAAAGPGFLQPSAYGRLELTGTPLPGAFSRIHAIVAAEFAYAFGRDGNAGVWGWTFGLDIGY